jgi:hypothetical protein
MDVQIKILGLDDIRKRLEAIPKGFDWVLRQTIRSALNKARTVADKAIREKYGIRQQASLRGIGKPYVSGSLWGVIHSSGKRLSVQDYVGIKVSHNGITIPWLKNAPATYEHAFQHGKSGPIMEREGRARYPLEIIKAPASIPEMLGQQKDIQPKIEAAMKTEAESELERLCRLVLSQGGIPKSRFSK